MRSGRLHKKLVQYGAGFLQYLDSKTMATHIIASSFPPKKALEFSRYRVVKPAWVMDSIEAGKLLPWSDYRVISDGPGQKTIKFDGGKMLAQASQRQSPLRYREQTQNSFYDRQFQRMNKDGAGQTESSPMSRSFSHSALRAMESIDDNEMDVDPPPSPKDVLSEAEQPSNPTIFEKESEDTPEDLYVGDESPGPALAEVSAPSDTEMLAPGAPAPDAPNPPDWPMTSEEHNVWLLSDPKIRKSSTANPNFLKQFYSESRLHHLSTWKAELKSKTQRLAAERGLAAKGVKRRPGSRRYIMHVDFDSFFCAVSLKRAPEYADKPAVVAHSTGSGSEIASCNYPSRKFGVKNGMWMKKALELCPDLKVLPYDFPAYEVASGLFYEAVFDVGGVVQSVSVDEALVDITSLVLSATGSDGFGSDESSLRREQDEANNLATSLRKEIREKTACEVSVGIGSNILLAKMALRKAKPAGQYQVKPDEVLDILCGLEVKSLPGVAFSTSGKLEEIGVKLVKDLREVSKERLVKILGPKTGEKLWEYSRGVDRTEIGDQPVRKSVSAEVNWGIRFINQEEAEEFVMNLCKELEKRLLNERVKGKNLTMKIMRRRLDAPLDPAKHLGHGRCDTFNKSTVFGVATHKAEAIGKEAVLILRSFKFSPGDLRGLGVQLQKLEPIKPTATGWEGSQKRLTFGNFETPPAKRTKREAIDDDDHPDRGGPAPGKENPHDPIADDPLTPRKPKISPGHPALALARAGEADAKATTPLNTSGTQFLLPSNVDAAVLAELPQDIRSRLKAQQRRASTSRGGSPAAAAAGRSRTGSPAIRDDLPPDFDPEVFNALPEDIKAEVLAQSRHHLARDALPQSPGLNMTKHNPAPKKTPTKRKVRNLWTKTHDRQQDVDARLQETNLATENRGQPDDVEELDPAFLAELPEDMRQELLADHRRRLARRTGPAAAPHRRPGAGGRGDGDRPGQARLTFAAPPRKAAFTSSGLTTTGEIEDMLDAWHRETRGEGPHRADVALFEQYLARVVGEERDMDKARRLVTWLDWLVEEDGGGGDKEEGVEGREAAGLGQGSWRKSIEGIKEAVQAAVRGRGLGPMKFG